MSERRVSVTCRGWCAWSHLNLFPTPRLPHLMVRGVHSICFLYTIHENHHRLSLLMQTWSLVIERWHCHFLLYYHMPHQLQETAQDKFIWHVTQRAGADNPTVTHETIVIRMSIVISMSVHTAKPPSFSTSMITICCLEMADRDEGHAR